MLDPLFETLRRAWPVGSQSRQLAIHGAAGLASIGRDFVAMAAGRSTCIPVCPCLWFRSARSEEGLLVAEIAASLADEWIIE